MDEVLGFIFVMEGQPSVRQVQGAGAVKDEMVLVEAEEGDLGDEQTDAAGHGTTDPKSKDISNTADAGKTLNASKARKRTKTGCLSELEEHDTGSLSRLI